MRYCIIVFILFFNTLESHAARYAPYAWQNRPVLVFTPSLNDLKYRQQIQAFAQAQADLEDRQIQIVTILPERVIDGAGEAATLRKDFDIRPGDFAVILVGYDTREKSRSRDVVDPRQIFDLIDTMPIRRQEMRNH